ncbi:MAG: LysR family transcriptional regulator [Hyphomicrobiaceae bacterium]|nr:LysR family transcriptional regulator [Hyphomicrobiaceae bacterium]
MDRFESMSMFVAVVRQGGFSAASRSLGVPLATVSRKVAALEEALGVQLLVRTNRSVTLTDVGREYYESTRRVLEDVAEIERNASGAYSEPRGHLVVSAPVAMGQIHLSPILIEFLRSYPGIDVELRLTNTFVDLVEDRIDIALRVGHLADSSMSAARVGEIRPITCASPAYLAQFGSPTHPRDLIEHDCITMVPLESSSRWTFRIGKKIEKFPTRERLSVTTSETAADAAISGVGVARLFCYQIASAVADRRVELLLQEFEPEPVPVQLVYLSARRMAQKLRAFIDFVQPRLKSRLVFRHT